MWAALAAHTPLWLSTADARLVGGAAIHALLAGMLWFVARRVGRYYGTALVKSTLFALAPTAAPIIQGERGAGEIAAYLLTPLITFGCGHLVGWIGSKCAQDRRWASLLILVMTAACLTLGLWSFRRAAQRSPESEIHAPNSTIDLSRGTATSG